jgi:hypothetical protein
MFILQKRVHKRGQVTLLMKSNLTLFPERLQWGLWPI